MGTEALQFQAEEHFARQLAKPRAALRLLRQAEEDRLARAATVMRELRPVLQFLGYGNPNAPVWFVGLEEGLSSGVDGDAHLLVRSAFPRVLDCAAAHRALGIHHLHGLEGAAVKVQSTWRQMAYLMLALSGATHERARECVANYQAKLLGAQRGQSFLAELMPLPRSRQNSWPYAELFADAWDSPHDYQQDVWPVRLSILQGALSGYAPKLVVCYGRGPLASARFDELVAPARLDAVPGTPFRAAYGSGQAFLHVPHFAQRKGAFPRDQFLCVATAAALLVGLTLPLEAG